MLVYGLIDWGGPARGTERLAAAMGFSSDLDDLEEEGGRIAVPSGSGVMSTREARREERCLVAAHSLA